MPKKEKTLAENIANLGEDATLSGFIASIEEIGRKDPEKLAAAGGFLQSLKNLNSGKKDLVQGAINSLNDIDDWLIERGKSGKTNYEELAEALGKDKMRELILYLNRKLGLDLEPDALAKGLKKLKQLDGNNFGADVVDTGKVRYMGEEYSPDYVHEEAKMPPESENNQPEIKNEPKIKKEPTPEVNPLEGAVKGEYLPKKIRDGHKGFFYKVSSQKIEEKVHDKGFFGLRGYSEDYKKFVDAYDEMTTAAARVVNEKDNHERVYENKINAMTKAKAAALEYIAKKRKEAKVDPNDKTWRPRTPMGRNHFEAALTVVEEIDKEFERLYADKSLETKEPEKANKNTVEQPAQQNQTDGVLPDPENPYDKQGWLDKLDSIPKKMPADPEAASHLALEQINCVNAIFVIDDVEYENIPEELRTKEFFRERFNEKYNANFKDNFEPKDAAHKWNYSATLRAAYTYGPEFIDNMTEEDMIREGFDVETIRQDNNAERDLTNEQIEDGSIESSILPDPDDLFDRNAWEEKLNSIPKKKPNDPELMEKITKEVINCTTAMTIIDKVADSIPEAERTNEKFKSIFDQGMEELIMPEFEGKNPTRRWNRAQVMRMAVERGDLDDIEDLPDDELEEAGIDVEEYRAEQRELMEQKEPEKPEEAVEFDTFNSEHYIKALKQVDFNGDDYGKLKDTVLFMTAGYVNLKILQNSDKMPTEEEFIVLTDKMMKSPAFKQTILDNGGEGWNGLKNVTQNFLKDDGKRFYADFMQNSLHEKQREEQYEKIKQDAQKQRELEMNKPKSEHVLGQNV